MRSLHGEACLCLYPQGRTKLAFKERSLSALGLLGGGQESPLG